jgi:hypothetical protein
VAVDNPDVIDIISVDVSGRVILTVSDHLDWSDPISHQQVLQAKINSYLAFIESGQILDSYPLARGKQMVVKVVTKYQLDRGGPEFLDRAKAALAEAGVQLQWERLASTIEN